MELVIGLEIHAQLKSKHKLFCSCPVRFGAPPNSLICPICTGQPGALPVLHAEPIRLAWLAGMALQCNLQETFHFARKHYMYADLPKGYQITQGKHPIGWGGMVEVELPDRSRKHVGLQRIHIEEDAGQLIHVLEEGVSQVDFNRCGVSLLEIVTKPVLHSAEEAVAFLRGLREILLFLDVCDGNMQEGSLRCDVNLSLRPDPVSPLGVRTEIKNMNSFRFMADAIRYETERHRRCLEAGELLVPETRLWDVSAQKTRVMRRKETAEDYRYMPEPDLPPINVSKEALHHEAGPMPELPLARRDRWLKQGVSFQDAQTLCGSKDLADYFDECMGIAPSAKIASHWIVGEFLRILNKQGSSVQDCLFLPLEFGCLLSELKRGLIVREQAKAILQYGIEMGASYQRAKEQLGIGKVASEDAVKSAIAEVLTDNSSVVKRYQQGETKVLGFLMGKLREATDGKASMKEAGKLLREALESE